MRVELLVGIAKSVIENDFSSVFVNKDLSVEGESSYGFVTDSGIYSPADDSDLDGFKKEFGISENAEYKKLELGNINDIVINFNEGDFDEGLMDEVANDLYNILGSKFDLMTVESNPR